MKIDENFLPKNWKLISLPELLFFQEGPGVRKHQFTTDGVKLINGGNIVNNELILENTKTYISKDEAYGKYGHFLVDEGDLIIASSGIKVDYFDKKIAFVEKQHLPLCMNTSTIRFKSLNSDILDINYFKHFMMTPFFAKQVQFYITGSAQLNFGPSHLKKMKVIVPPLKIQNRIVRILEKAKQLKEWRVEADAFTDKYIKSLFLEMFGDINLNNKNWELTKIIDIGDVKTGGTPSRKIKEYWEKGDIPWVKTTEVNGSIIKNAQEFITKEGLRNSGANLFPKNTILVAMYGQGKTRGRAGKLGINAATNQACAAILPSNRYNTDYLWYFLYVSYENLRELGRGGNQPNLNLSMIKNFEIHNPPLELQNQFAKIVRRVETLRTHQSQSKEMINNLLGTLTQKAFKGELIC